MGEQRLAAGRMAKIAKLCCADLALAKRVQEFADRAGLSDNGGALDDFLALLADVANAGVSGNSTSIGDSSPASSDLDVVKVDKNICCFATGKLYTEALLGIGVSREKRNLSTAAELLSKEAFDGGLRQGTNKSPFEYFLPVWINEAHSAKSQAWREALKRSYMEIGHNVYQASGEDESIIEVFPRLINQMIVEVMRPDAAKSAAIATFEALCNFWRTLRWLVDTRTTLLARLSTKLSNFVSDESHRHKDSTRDLGMLLVLFTSM